MHRILVTIWVPLVFFGLKCLQAQPLGHTEWAVIEIQDSKFFPGSILDQPHTYKWQGDTGLVLKLKHGPTYEIIPVQHFATPRLEILDKQLRIRHSSETITGAVLHFKVVRRRFLSKQVVDVKIEGLTIPSSLTVKFGDGDLWYNFYEKFDPVDYEYSVSHDYLEGDRFNITEAVSGQYEPIWTETPVKIEKDRRLLQDKINAQHRKLYQMGDGHMKKVFGPEVFSNHVTRVSASSEVDDPIGFMRNDTLATAAYFTYKYENEEAKAAYFVKFGINLSGEAFDQSDPILNYHLSLSDFAWVPTKQVEDSMTALFPKVMLIPKKTRRGKKLVKNNHVKIEVIFSEHLPEGLKTDETEFEQEIDWKPKFVYMVKDYSNRPKTTLNEPGSSSIWYFDCTSGQYIGHTKH